MADVELDIIDVMEADEFFGRHFRGPSWISWKAFLRALFGLPMSEAELEIFRRHTDRVTPPSRPFGEAVLPIGRRGGKTKMMAFIAVFLAFFKDYGEYLSPGERGAVHLISQTRDQARIIFWYIKGLINDCPPLRQEVVSMKSTQIVLLNNIVIEISTASFRSTRGYTIVAALCDETALWHNDETSRNPDSEILRALRPAMATIPTAMLLIASSPYGKRGELWNLYRRYFGVDTAPTLVWQADTRTMNPRVTEAFLAAKYEEDPIGAASEYGAEFRDDASLFIDPELVDELTMWGRVELPPQAGVSYFGFVDPSGGRDDSMTFSIVHLEGLKVVQDVALEIRPPFDPFVAVAAIAEKAKLFRLARITSDRYAGDWPRAVFSRHGIAHEACKKVKDLLYLDFLPLLTGKRLELLDVKRQHSQLCALHRTPGRGGRDKIDHPRNAHDDLVNALAGAAVMLDLDRRQPLAVPIELEPAVPLVFPVPAMTLFGVLAFSKQGEVAVVYAARSLTDQERLYVLDFDLSPLGRFAFPEILARMQGLYETTRANHAEYVSICVPLELVVAAREVFGDGAVTELPFELKPELLLVPAAQHVNAGRVRFVSEVLVKASSSPWAAAFEFRIGDATDDPLRAAAVLAIILGLDGADTYRKGIRERTPAPYYGELEPSLRLS
jgi:hypothetical protein